MIDSKKIKCLLFDMDGTVLASEDLFDKAQLLLLKEYGISSNSFELKEFKGMSYKDFYPNFIKKFRIKDSISDLRVKLRNYFYGVMDSNLVFIDGFEDYFNKYIKNTTFKVGLVTNTTRLSYKKIQSCINIDDYFSFVLTVDEVLKPKPSPQPYIQAMGHFSSKPNQTVIFEDSKTGLTSAVNSKANVIGLTTSLSKKNIKEIDENILVIDSYYNLKSGFNIS